MQAARDTARFGRRALWERRLWADLGLIALVLVVAGVLYVRATERRLIDSTGESLAMTAGSIASELDTLLVDAARDAEMLAATVAFQQGDPAAMGAALAATLGARPAYAWLAAAGASGRIDAATQASLVGADVHEADWFAAVRDGHRLDVREENRLRLEVTRFRLEYRGPVGEHTRDRMHSFGGDIRTGWIGQEYIQTFAV